MAITQGTLGSGRIGLQKLFAIEAEQVDKTYLDVVGGQVDHTDQTSVVYKQYIGFGPSAQTPEGAKVDWDDLNALYTMVVKPLLYTKGVKFTLQTKYTDQYGVLKDITPKFADAFYERRNVNVSDLDNSGFSNTTYGQNSEVLYSGSHNMNGVYSFNRPLAPGTTPSSSPTTLDFAFGPLGLEQCYIDMKGQVSARNLPMVPRGKIDIKVPRQLMPQAWRAIRATQLAGGNFNDPNFNRDAFGDPKENLYYTSSTAWFALASNKRYHGLFFLEQMPYEIKDLPLDDELMVKWVAYESWSFGWWDWHGSWGTAGA